MGCSPCSSRANCARESLEDEGRPRAGYTPVVIIVEGPAVSEVEKDARKALAIGAGVALVVSLVPLLRFIFSYLLVLVHEMGHTVSNWVFGYGAIPALDFMYGGGVTIYGERSRLLFSLPIAGLALLIWRVREQPRLRWGVVGLAGVYLVLALSPAHRHLITAMGHGTELIIAGVFIYRSISGAIRVEIERPLYAACGLFIVFECLRFAAGLMRSASARRAYENAKGGGHWMDFSQLAGVFELQVQVIAGAFFLAALAVPALAWLAFRYREHLRAFVEAQVMEP